MRMNDFKWFEASGVEILDHLIAECKDIMADDECLARTDFRYFASERHDASCPTARGYTDGCKRGISCGTYRCFAGWLAYRSGLDIKGAEFNDLFMKLNSVTQRLLGSDNWGSIFGAHTFRHYTARLRVLEGLRSNFREVMERKIISNEKHAFIGSAAKRLRDYQRANGLERLSYMQTCIAIRDAYPGSYQEAPTGLPSLDLQKLAKYAGLADIAAVVERGRLLLK